jgi:hypothetical protein
MAEKNWGARWDAPRGNAPRWDEKPAIVAQQKAAPDDTVRCPYCKSTQLYAGKRGFKIGCFGLLLLSPVLVIAMLFFWPVLLLLIPVGFMGGNKIRLTCMQCGRVSRPG